MIFWNPFTGSVDWIHKDTQRSWYMAWVRVWQRQLIQNRGGGLELCSCCRVLVKLERSLGFLPQHCIKPVVAFHAYNPNTQEVEAESRKIRDSRSFLTLFWAWGQPGPHEIILKVRGAWQVERRGRVPAWFYVLICEMATSFGSPENIVTITSTGFW